MTTAALHMVCREGIEPPMLKELQLYRLVPGPFPATDTLSWLQRSVRIIQKLSPTSSTDREPFRLEESSLSIRISPDLLRRTVPHEELLILERLTALEAVRHRPSTIGSG